MKDMLTVNTQVSNFVRRQDFDGNEVLVAPVVMITTGVHCGSGGCVAYTNKEIQESVKQWNGRPVTLGHPDAEVTNSPEVIEEIGIGQIFNTTFEEGKLKAEVWINIEKANKVDSRIVKRIEMGEVTEVSTGLYSNRDPDTTIFNGEPCEGSVFNIKPDHLAVLLDDVGACSVTDGAGLPRVNSSLVNKIVEIVESNIKKEMRMTKLINALIGDDRFQLTEDDREFLESLSEDKLKKFVPVDNKQFVPVDNKQDDVKQDDVKQDDNAVDNKKDDVKQDDNAVDNKQDNKVVDDKQIVVKPKTFKELLNEADPSTRDAILNAVKTHNSMVSDLKNKIVENSDLTEDELPENIETLKKLSNSLVKEEDHSSDFSLNGVGLNLNKNDWQAPAVPTIDWDTGAVKEVE